MDTLAGVIICLGNFAMTYATLVLMWASDPEFGGSEDGTLMRYVPGTVWMIFGIALTFSPLLFVARY